jgi:phosphate transport system substrate-binding protein
MLIAFRVSPLLRLARAWSVAFVCVAMTAACTSSAPSAGGAIRIAGAGSTFDTPFFAKAIAQYSQSTGVNVTFASSGSLSGVQDFTRGSVDFGASDIPMDEHQLTAYPGGANAVVQLPVALCGVVIAYNVPGLSDDYIPHRTHLRFTPDLIGKIFSGSIKMWNDPALAALNGGVKLPAVAISVVNRVNASQATSVFIDYLGDSSPSWNAYVRKKNRRAGWGDAASGGDSGDGNVAAQIMSSPGSIGYVEMSSVLGTKTNYAAIRNRAGNYVLPSMVTVRAAAAQQVDVSPTNFYIDDLGGAKSYPIAGYSWLLISRNNADAAKTAALCSFAHWMLTGGQLVAPSVGDVPLPTNLAQTALAALGPCTGGS